MMNTELCVFYIEIQRRNAAKEITEEFEISLLGTMLSSKIHRISSLLQKMITVYNLSPPLTRGSA